MTASSPGVEPSAGRTDRPWPVDTARPHPARRYDYWLGGKDNFAADRHSADQIAAVFPAIRTAAVENRRFLHRAVTFLTAEAGIDQFLDIGAGLPTAPNTHQIAQQITPTARVVYVDNDPMVIAHARAKMTSASPGTISYAHADLRDPDTILNHPAVHETLDLTRPVGLLLIAVLHFLDDNDHPYRAVAHLVAALPPASHVALSHATLDPLPADTVERLTALTNPQAGHGTFRPRTRTEIARFLDGLTLVDPGLVPIVAWRPEQPPAPEATPAQAAAYAATAFGENADFLDAEVPRSTQGA